MAHIDALIEKVTDAALRSALRDQVDAILNRRSFGLASGRPRLRDTDLVAWYRNPTSGPNALRVPYLGYLAGSDEDVEGLFRDSGRVCMTARLSHAGRPMTRRALAVHQDARPVQRSAVDEE